MHMHIVMIILMAPIYELCRLHFLLFIVWLARHIDINCFYCRSLHELLAYKTWLLSYLPLVGTVCSVIFMP